MAYFLLFWYAVHWQPHPSTRNSSHDGLDVFLAMHVRECYQSRQNDSLNIYNVKSIRYLEQTLEGNVVTEKSLKCFIFTVWFFTVCLTQVQTHVCILKKRPVPSMENALEWSLPNNERCLCQRVVAPSNRSQFCQENNTNVLKDNIYFFVNDPRSLILRQNWNKATLDKLLNRTGYCGDVLSQL